MLHPPTPRVASSCVFVSVVLVAASASAAGTGEQDSQPPAATAAGTAHALAAAEYAAPMTSLVDHVGAGRIDEAVAVLTKHSRRGFGEEQQQQMRQLFARIYGSGGEYDGHDLAALQTVTSRLHRLYIVGYHEARVMVYKFTVCQFQGRWMIVGFEVGDKLTELEKHARMDLLLR